MGNQHPTANSSVYCVLPEDPFVCPFRKCLPHPLLLGDGIFGPSVLLDREGSGCLGFTSSN